MKEKCLAIICLKNIYQLLIGGLNIMEYKSEGICRFCLKTFAGSTINRHLLTCKDKKERDTRDAAKAKRSQSIYHLKLFSSKYYWLHVEMKANSTLYDLDQFLRNIWLECCGHLSAFTINGVRYEDLSSQDDMFLFGEKPESIKTKLNTVLDVGDKFEYEYDFGTTTYIEGKVLASRKGELKEKVKILARNNPYTFECEECGQQATDFCTECETMLCEKCLEEHECGEEMALPVVNSPRMGQCAYTGEFDFDDFSV